MAQLSAVVGADLRRGPEIRRAALLCSSHEPPARANSVAKLELSTARWMRVDGEHGVCVVCSIPLMNRGGNGNGTKVTIIAHRTEEMCCFAVGCRWGGERGERGTVLCEVQLMKGMSSSARGEPAGHGIEPCFGLQRKPASQQLPPLAWYTSSLE
eukprot:536123-Rhodomonas_salina.1